MLFGLLALTRASIAATGECKEGRGKSTCTLSTARRSRMVIKIMQAGLLTSDQADHRVALESTPSPADQPSGDDGLRRFE